jgi:hypothetical protein
MEYNTSSLGTNFAYFKFILGMFFADGIEEAVHDLKAMI